MELTDPTTVRITVHENHEARLTGFIGRQPDDRDPLAFPGRVVLTFDSWDVPEAWHFHCPDIPFLGSHDGGVSYGPHRMCGNGDRCAESTCDLDERLCILLAEPSGLPDVGTLNSARRFLDFEGLCRERIERCEEAVT